MTDGPFDTLDEALRSSGGLLEALYELPSLKKLYYWNGKDWAMCDPIIGKSDNN
jgi:hypothetical protein